MQTRREDFIQDLKTGLSKQLMIHTGSFGAQYCFLLASQAFVPIFDPTCRDPRFFRSSRARL